MKTDRNFIRFSKTRILSLAMRAFCWIPFSLQYRKGSPHPEAIKDESPEWGIQIGEDSIARRTDPILMTQKERRENTVRMWMEFKGYSRKDVEKDLTDERLKELGRMTSEEYSNEVIRLKEKYGETIVSTQ